MYWSYTIISKHSTVHVQSCSLQKFVKCQHVTSLYSLWYFFTYFYSVLYCWIHAPLLRLTNHDWMSGDHRLCLSHSVFKFVTYVTVNYSTCNCCCHSELWQEVHIDDNFNPLMVKNSAPTLLQIPSLFSCISHISSERLLSHNCTQSSEMPLRFFQNSFSLSESSF
jgi:hypothetical protein